MVANHTVYILSSIYKSTVGDLFRHNDNMPFTEIDYLPPTLIVAGKWHHALRVPVRPSEKC